MSSWVDSGLEAHSVTFAPEAESARMRFAVSVVTCMQAPMRTPALRIASMSTTWSSCET